MILRRLMVLAVTATVVSQAIAQSEEPKPTRPKIGYIGQENRDWRGLEQMAGSSPFDILRDISAPGLEGSDAGSISFGGAFRVRSEYFNNFHAAPANDDGFLLTHLRLNMNYWITDRVRVFAEGKSTFSTERDLPGGQRTLDTDHLDLQQLFGELSFDIGDVEVVVRGGRQQLKFGAQRLVSPLPWGNSLRAWDGGRVDIKFKDWTITPFYTVFAPVQKFEFNDSDTDQKFWGAYATGNLFKDHNIKADVYFLGSNKDFNVTFNGTTGAEDRYTVGARFYRPKGNGFDFDVEGAYQFGEVGAGDVSAWFVDGEFGWTFAGAGFKPRVFVGGGAASGDDGSGGDVGTFNQLYPLGHAYLGFADQVGRQNILEVRGGVSAKLAKGFSVRVAGHAF